MSIFVCSSEGFIKLDFVIDGLDQHDEPIINIDNLTYVGKLQNISPRGAINFVECD